MTVLASYSIKGGVGKTATAVNLAFLSAQEGARTLIWDMDPQGATSFYFRVKPKLKGGMKRLFARRTDPRKAIRGTDYDCLDLLPADFSTRKLDVLLHRSRKPLKRFGRLLRTLRAEYDVIYLDCTPSIGVTSECVFRKADLLIVPSIPTTLSVNTLEKLSKHLGKMNGSGPIVLPFFSMLDKRKKLHRIISENTKAMPFDFLNTVIPYSSKVELMGTHRAPLATYAGRSKPARAYQELRREIGAHLTRRIA